MISSSVYWQPVLAVDLLQERLEFLVASCRAVEENFSQPPMASHSSLKPANMNLSFKGTPCDNTSWLGRSPAEAQVTPTTSSLCLKKPTDGYKHVTVACILPPVSQSLFSTICLLPSLHQTSSREDICIKKERFSVLGTYINMDILSSAVVMFHLCGKDTPALLEIWLPNLRHEQRTQFIMDRWLCNTWGNFFKAIQHVNPKFNHICFLLPQWIHSKNGDNTLLKRSEVYEIAAV